MFLKKRNQPGTEEGIRLRDIAAETLGRNVESSESRGVVGVASRQKVLYDVFGHFASPQGGGFLKIDNGRVYVDSEALQNMIYLDQQAIIRTAQEDALKRQGFLDFMQQLPPIGEERSYQPTSWMGNDQFQVHLQFLAALAIRKKMTVRIMAPRFSALIEFPSFKAQLAQIARKSAVEVILLRTHVNEEVKQWLLSNNAKVYLGGESEFAVQNRRFMIVGETYGITVHGEEIVDRTGIFYRNVPSLALFRTFEKIKAHCEEMHDQL